MFVQDATIFDAKATALFKPDEPSMVGHAKSKRRVTDMVNMGVEPRTLALLAPRSKPTELIDRDYHVIDDTSSARAFMYLAVRY